MIIMKKKKRQEKSSTECFLKGKGNSFVWNRKMPSDFLLVHMHYCKILDDKRTRRSVYGTISVIIIKQASYDRREKAIFRVGRGKLDFSL